MFASKKQICRESHSSVLLHGVNDVVNNCRKNHPENIKIIQFITDFTSAAVLSEAMVTQNSGLSCFISGLVPSELAPGEKIKAHRKDGLMLRTV